MQFPSSDLIPDFLRRLLRDGWTETTEDFPLSDRKLSVAETCTPESQTSRSGEPPPIRILAIDNFRLLRMQFQSTLLQPCRYFDTHQVRFPLCSAMDYDIVRVPLERQMRPISPHPQIERVVQKQIGQQGADHSPYTKGNFQLEQMVTGWRAKYSVLDLRLKK